MAANFEIKINAINTGTVDSLTGVIRRVEFTIKGIEDGQSFELPQVVELSNPTPESFVQLDNLTEAQVIKFVEDDFTNMDAVKAHIQYVLDKEVAKASLENAPLPWAPVVETPAPQA